MNHLRTIRNLDTVFAYLSFNRLGVAQKLLHEIKYKDQEALAGTVGEWFGHHIKEKVESCKIDSIVPIPLHRNKLKRRGYNQSELIAEGMSSALDIPCETGLLERAKFTATQTKKGKAERWVNVKDIFVINRKVELENKHLLLVDDVITTGATIESAANTLNTAGTSKVSIGCIATGRK
ncbi:MAG: ComF family protein [Cyclobacteriaceae bacterium]